MKVVEDFELRPHKAVCFVVEKDKEVQEWNEQKLPKVLPGFNGGRLPCAENSRAKCQARLGLLADRRRGRAGRGDLTKRKPNGGTMGRG